MIFSGWVVTRRDRDDDWESARRDRSQFGQTRFASVTSSARTNRMIPTVATKQRKLSAIF